MAFGPGLLELLSALEDGRESGVTADRAVTKHLNQVTSPRRVHLIERPEHDKKDQNKLPKMISVHESKLGLAGLAVALGNFRNGGLGDFEFGVGGAEGEGLFFDRHDDTDDAAGRHDFISGPDGLEEFGQMLLLFLLRADECEVKHDHQQAQRRQASPERRRLLTRLRGRRQR